MAKLFNSLPLLNRWIELDNGYRFKLQRSDAWNLPYVLFFESNDPNEQMPVYRVYSALEAINEICKKIGATKVVNYPFEKLPEFDKMVWLNDYWVLEVLASIHQSIAMPMPVVDSDKILVNLIYYPKEKYMWPPVYGIFETEKKAIEFINSFCLNNNINPELPCAELSF